MTELLLMKCKDIKLLGCPIAFADTRVKLHKLLDIGQAKLAAPRGKKALGAFKIKVSLCISTVSQDFSASSTQCAVARRSVFGQRKP